MTDKEKDAVWRSLPEAFKEEVRGVYKAYKYASKSSKDVFANGCVSTYDFLFGTHNLTAEKEEKPREDKPSTKDELKEYAVANRERLAKQEVKLGDVVKILKGAFAGEHGTVKEVQACCGYDPDDLFFTLEMQCEVPQKYRIYSDNPFQANKVGGFNNTDFEVIGNVPEMSGVVADEIRKEEEEMQKSAAELLDRLNHPEKEYTYEVTLDKIRVNDWLPYRMELAKEVTIAMIRSIGRVKDSEVFEIVDGIVERLKGE